MDCAPSEILIRDPYQDSCDDEGQYRVMTGGSSATPAFVATLLMAEILIVNCRAVKMDGTSIGTKLRNVAKRKGAGVRINWVNSVRVTCGLIVPML